MNETKEQMASRIVEAEWKLFQSVPNIGGRAACQDDYATFEINRFAQAMGWSEAALESYLLDLADAEQHHRNLLTEKYGHMMRSTSPTEYDSIKHLLPPLDPEAVALIEEIARIVMGWTEQLAVRFPFILKKGRPLHSSEDTPFVTSIETYLRGELATYSCRTLRLLYEHYRHLASEGVNGTEIIYDNTVRRYGYGSLESANKSMAARA